MPKQKRDRDLDDDAVDLDDAYVDRKKRVKYTEADAQLARIYNDLADEVASVRVKAAGELLKSLSTESSDRDQRLDSAEGRLIKGLCSGRKAARLGFSVALAEVFRLRFQLQSGNEGDIKLGPRISRIRNLTEVQGNVSGQERRDSLLGRRFALQALLHSDVGLSPKVTEAEWKELLHATFELASQKQWLRREIAVMLYEYLVSESATQLPNDRLSNIITSAQEGKLLETPEGVGLWLTVASRFPEVKLPKGVWQHRNPLSSKERPHLSKVMLETSEPDEDAKKKTGTRQVAPSFAWKVILARLYKDDNAKAFKHFWKETVVDGMFSTTTSAERRALGFQVVSMALTTAPADLLTHILHKNIVKCIFDQRAESSRYLFDAAKLPLNQIVERAKAESQAAKILCVTIIERHLYNFDGATKTKTVEQLFNAADDDGLSAITSQLLAELSSLSNEGATSTDRRVRELADLTMYVVRQRKNPASITLAHDIEQSTNAHDNLGWQSRVLITLVNASYDPAFLPGDKTVLRSRLMSCLNNLLSCPLGHAIKAPVLVMQEAAKHYRGTGLEQAQQYMYEAYEQHSSDASSRAFALLFSLSIIQVLNEEPDAQAALDDLTACYQSRHDKGDSLTMLVELLLSFISKPSALFRKLAEQAFSAFAGDLTADALQSLIDILGQKESLKGQQELFADGEHQDGDDQGPDMEVEEDGIDVEDASDVELVNGEEAPPSHAESDEDGDDSDSASASSAEAGADNDPNDEEAIFDRKLAEALGTNTAADNASSFDGSDMDDDQMLALEPHLATIFRERRAQSTTRKHDSRAARENIVNFKNRVLDLLAIYVKSQYGDVLALDLILPLCVLVRETSSPATRERAFEVLKRYFDLAGKFKASPRPPGDEGEEAVFALLGAVLGEMKQGRGAKVHGRACSRAGLFLSRVLVGLERGNYRRVAGMYAELQAEWWLGEGGEGEGGGGKVLGSVFTEWVSWSIGTRKAR